jgi:hypothetical protein
MSDGMVTRVVVPAAGGPEKMRLETAPSPVP